MMLKQAGFTLVEILVVITIISLITTIGIISYTSFNKTARDGRRKADLEQIRGALELYRSEKNAYPTGTGSFGLNFGSGGLTDGTNTYMSTVPQDPRTPQTYYYTSTTSDYTIATKLEGTSTCATVGTDCETTTATQACNYCLGPYGQK